MNKSWCIVWSRERLRKITEILIVVTSQGIPFMDVSSEIKHGNDRRLSSIFLESSEEIMQNRQVGYMRCVTDWLWDECEVITATTHCAVDIQWSTENERVVYMKGNMINVTYPGKVGIAKLKEHQSKYFQFFTDRYCV
jgi:hypothetical protein